MDNRVAGWALLTWLPAAVALAQEASPPPVQRVVGEVAAAESGRLTVKTDTGETVLVVTGDTTRFLRAQPGARDLAGAAPVGPGEVAVGDRVLARGERAADGGLAARQVVVMTRADIQQKQERERAEWRRRGIAGVVTALDATTREISLQVRGPAGLETVMIPTGGGSVVFRRYAPDSVRFADAKPSTFEEVRPGDQLRALGDRSPDGSRFVPEQVVSGAFRTVTGTVTSVDAAKGELVLEELLSGRKLTVAVSPDAMLRRLPTELMARLAGRTPEAPPGAPTPGAPAGPGARMGGGNLGDMLERLPGLRLEELKPRAVIVVSSTVGADAGRVTAVALVAGLEAFLPAGGFRRGAGVEASLGLPVGALDIGIGIP
jgi:hypothetical protein